jgi:hypothetical protein
MLHYFVDMQNKTPQALIDQAQKWRKKKCWKCFFVEETSIASITDLNSILKSGNLGLILIKAVDTAHLNSRCRPTGNIYYNTTIS